MSMFYLKFTTGKKNQFQKHYKVILTESNNGAKSEYIKSYKCWYVSGQHISDVTFRISSPLISVVPENSYTIQKNKFQTWWKR